MTEPVGSPAGHSPSEDSYRFSTGVKRARDTNRMNEGSEDEEEDEEDMN